MRWMLYAVVVLAALAVIVAVIGAALPKAHVASVTAQLAAPPDEVWRTITEVERFPEWRHGVTRVERIADQHGRTSWAEHSSEGRIPFVVERREPPRVLVVRIADASLPFGGTWTYEIVPEASGSTITITENGEVYNPIFRLVAKFVFGHDRTLRQYADSLGARLGSKERTHGV